MGLLFNSENYSLLLAPPPTQVCPIIFFRCGFFTRLFNSTLFYTNRGSSLSIRMLQDYKLIFLSASLLKLIIVNLLSFISFRFYASKPVGEVKNRFIFIQFFNIVALILN